MEAGDPRTPAAVEAFCLAVIDQLTGRVAAVKPQIALFEQLGSAGVAVLERVQAAARARELLVVLDAKRGDIASTADAYARAYLEPGAPLAADALTLNPYLGLDTLEPYLRLAETAGRGVFVLVRTSNAGARDLQDLPVDGAPLYERVAQALGSVAKRLTGPRTGWSSLGLVVGATWPAEGRRLRELLPDALFLVPGYGAQGASAADAVTSFRPGPGGVREGGLVNASRSILFPEGAESAGAGAWERAIESALDRSIAELAEAVAR